MTLDELCDLLLPSSSTSHLIECLDADETDLTVRIAIIEPKATCPDCLAPTCRVHASYYRTLSDLSWASTPVQLHVQVRRFRCDTPSCKRQTFTECLPEWAPPYARTTARLSDLQTDIGLALGGAAGARRLVNQGLPGSRNTLLRRVRRYCPPEPSGAEIIGIDDWAKRKGHTYGTIIVDLERHRPVDLLPERTAEPVATWMKAHPDIRIVTRDRAEAYGSGVQEGAPHATQVADRWHLMKNLREALETEFSLRPIPPWEPLSETTEEGPTTSLLPSEAPSPPSIYPDTPSGRRAEAARQVRRSQRLAQYELAYDLRQQGLSQAVIACKVGVSPRTLTRWFKVGTFPERQRRRGDRHRLAPYAAYLQQRWAQGCRNAMHLWREVRDQGFTGSYARVAAYVRPLRRGQAAPRVDAKQLPEPSVTNERPVVTARDLSYLLIRRASDRTDDEQMYLERVKQHDAVMADMITVAEDFTQMIRDRVVDGLEGWLEAVTSSSYSSLKRLATGIRQDLSAVRAALELPFSNGQTEGQVTRLKLLKRQMYGRAKLDLLRQRVLYAT